jgi:hypothetical protein
MLHQEKSGNLALIRDLILVTTYVRELDKTMSPHLSGPGVDVMITIFCDFCQFTAKVAFFSKKQCYDQIFA